MSNGQGGFYGGVMNLMGQQQMSPDRLRQMLMGEEGSGGVGDILNQQQGLYGSMMAGKIPPSLRMNVMGGAHDLAAGQTRNINRTLGMGGMSPGSNLGAQLSQISDSQIGNQAINQLGKLNLDTMKMGGAGMADVLQTRKGINASMAGLERSNIGESNQWGGAIGGLIGKGIKDWFGGVPGGQQGGGDPQLGGGVNRGMNLLNTAKGALTKGGTQSVMQGLGGLAGAAAPWALGAGALGALYHNRKGVGKFFNKINPFKGWG